jgi:hypothetical protein
MLLMLLWLLPQPLTQLLCLLVQCLYCQPEQLSQVVTRLRPLSLKLRQHAWCSAV